MRPSPSARRQSNHGTAQYQGIQFMPDKENGAGFLGKKQGGGCTRRLFSQVVQPEISYRIGTKLTEQYLAEFQELLKHNRKY